CWQIKCCKQRNFGQRAVFTTSGVVARALRSFLFLYPPSGLSLLVIFYQLLACDTTDAQVLLSIKHQEKFNQLVTCFLIYMLPVAAIAGHRTLFSLRIEYRP